MNGNQSSQTAQSAGGLCLDHENRISRNKGDICKLFKEVDKVDEKREKSVDSLHTRINVMQWSIVAAMGAVLLQVVIFVLDKLP